MSRPTIICIPGPCQPAEIYVPLQSALLPYGYSVLPISLPSIGNIPPPYDFAEDVIAIRSVVVELLEQQKDVIVVMQGFNGVSGSQALHGLGSIERQRLGLRGGIIRLVFIMGWVVKENFQAAPRGDVSNMFHYMKVDPSVSHDLYACYDLFSNMCQNGICTIDPAVAAKTFYNDLSPEEIAYWISRLQTQSLGIFWSKTSFAAWRCIPSTYVICGKDGCVDENYAKLILGAAKEDGRHMIDTIERCAEASHCPMLGKIQWTVNSECLRA